MYAYNEYKENLKKDEENVFSAPRTLPFTGENRIEIDWL